MPMCLEIPPPTEPTTRALAPLDLEHNETEGMTMEINSEGLVAVRSRHRYVLLFDGRCRMENGERSRSKICCRLLKSVRDEHLYSDVAMMSSDDHRGS
jgi:hypothetical protein